MKKAINKLLYSLSVELKIERKGYRTVLMVMAAMYLGMLVSFCCMIFTDSLNRRGESNFSADIEKVNILSWRSELLTNRQLEALADAVKAESYYYAVSSDKQLVPQLNSKLPVSIVPLSGQVEEIYKVYLKQGSFLTQEMLSGADNKYCVVTESFEGVKLNDTIKIKDTSYKIIGIGKLHELAESTVYIPKNAYFENSVAPIVQQSLNFTSAERTDLAQVKIFFEKEKLDSMIITDISGQEQMNAMKSGNGNFKLFSVITVCFAVLFMCINIFLTVKGSMFKKLYAYKIQSALGCGNAALLFKFTALTLTQSVLAASAAFASVPAVFKLLGFYIVYDKAKIFTEGIALSALISLVVSVLLCYEIIKSNSTAALNREAVGS